MQDEVCIDHAYPGKRRSRDPGGGRCEPDVAIAELAERQHGVVERRQLMQLGLGRGMIDERLAKGRLHRLHRGVYAVGHRVLSRNGRWMAAVLASGAGAVLSHRSAGALWCLMQWSGEIEVTRERKCRSRDGIRVHFSALAGDETTVIDGIPVTSFARTLFDLAVVLPQRKLERAWNEAEVRRLTDRLSVPDLLERHPRCRGVAKLRALLGSKAPGGVTRNDFEEAFVALLDAQGLPRPRLNAAMHVRGRFIEADCLWQEQRLIVELDSRTVHDTDRGFEGDRLRDRVLLVEGWRCTRVTWRQLRDEPEAVAADLRLLLATS